MPTRKSSSPKNSSKPPGLLTRMMAPVDSRQLAVLRISFGLLALIYFFERLPFSRLYLSSAGWLDEAVFKSSFSGLLRLPESFQYWPVLLGLFLVFIGSAVLMTLGFATRVTTALTWVGLLLIENQNPLMQMRGTDALRIIVFFLIFSNAGGIWSIDAWLFKFRRQETSNWWSYYLIRIQIVMAFLLAAVSKLISPYWIEGDALVYLLLNPETSGFHPVTVAELGFVFFPLSSVVSRLWIAFELMFPLAALIPVVRPIILKMAAFAFVVAFFLLNMNWLPLLALAMLTGLMGAPQVKSLEKKVLGLRQRLSGTRAVARTKE